MTNDNPALVVRSASIVALRLFDVAYAIDLTRVEGLWTSHSRASVSRGRLAYTPSKALAFDVPPVSLTLDAVTMDIDGRERSASISVRFAIEPCDWSTLVRNTTAISQSIGPGASADHFWPEVLQRILSPLSAAFTRPTKTHLQEDYLYVVVREWGEPIDAREVLDRVDVTSVLTDDSRPLSPDARRELLRARFSYYADDLVVMNWDRAFIVEPRGETDVLEVLEVANAQLLEMRYYDELLDDELPRMYGLVEETRASASARGPGRFARLARQLYALVAEVTELTERVDNALQVTEDVYLARVYESALELMRVPKLSAAVDRKLAIIRDTYTALYEEASARRSDLLELTIVLLIVFEIVMALAQI
jgi:hypothetical protein